MRLFPEDPVLPITDFLLQTLDVEELDRNIDFMAQDILYESRSLPNGLASGPDGI